MFPSRIKYNGLNLGIFVEITLIVAVPQGGFSAEFLFDFGSFVRVRYSVILFFCRYLSLPFFETIFRDHFSRPFFKWAGMKMYSNSMSLYRSSINHVELWTVPFCSFLFVRWLKITILELNKTLLIKYQTRSQLSLQMMLNSRKSFVSGP